MRTVLVPLDGSVLAERSLPFAIHIARRTGARLELVVVSEPRSVFRRTRGAAHVEQESDARLRDALVRYADEVAARVGAEPDVAVMSRLLEGPAAITLARYVQLTAPDLLVVTSHGRAGGRREWLGSVTDGLVRTAPSPVLVVPTHHDEGDDEVPGAFTRVLVALDGTSACEGAIDQALALVGSERVRYVVMSAVQPLHPLVRAVAGEQEYQRDLAEQRGLVGEYLEGVAERLRAAGADVEVDVRVSSQPANAVLDAAVEHQAELIALATRRRAPLGRWLLGSVADKVLRGSPVPVLLCAMAPGGDVGEAGPEDGA